jgi:hypothetical protein
MSKTEYVASLVTKCLDRCRISGFTVAKVTRFLEELRANGHQEEDVQLVYGAMRRILRGVRLPEEFSTRADG